MMVAAFDIPNLLYRYADLMDAGRFDDAAELFDHGCIVSNGKEIRGRSAIAEFWRSFIKLHDNEMTNTRHLITNPQIEISEDGTRATGKSQWTGLQKKTDGTLTIVGTGRYRDEFAVIDGEWRFTRREYAKVDFWGEVSEHLKVDVADIKG